MEEENPDSDIEVGDEAVYLEADTYRVEDDEDEVPEGTIEEVSSDKEVEETPVENKFKKSVKDKDLPDRVNAS